MSQRQPRTRSEAKQAAASRTPGGPRGGGGSASSTAPKRRRRWLRRGLWTVLALGVLGLIGLGVAYARTDIPEPNEIATAEASIVYYADGETEMARLSDTEGNRVSVPLSQVPDHMQKAMLAGEDQDFYQNQGISPSGIARAVWVAVKGGQVTQGGSTITQQYVKNYFLTSDRTVSRKAREILIAIKIDRQQTKDEILENYLNTIYYGRGAYGIQTASKAYFNKDVSELTVAESAFLASVIRGPSFYDPGLGEEQAANAKQRSGFILDAMVEQGWLSQAERDAATFPDTFVKYKPRTQSGPAGYLVDMVRKELVATHKIPESEIERGGLRVVSTIERPKQVAMQKAIKDQRPSEKDVSVGMASVKPGDGAIVALYGGADFAKRPQNAATQDKMQAGSTFKIFTLIAALQSGDVALKSVYDGNSPRYFEEFADPGADTEAARRGRVKNFGDNSFGRIDLREATGSSVNTVYADLNIEAGAKNSMKAAEDAGIKSPLEANPGNVLGTDYVTVLDMVTAYATIAAEGVRATPYIVKEVRFLDEGVPAIKVEPQTQQVFDEDLMSDVIDAMTYPVEGGTAKYVGENLGRPAAGKTGTSESFRSAWFDGYVPQLATAVGLYRSGENGEELAMENLPTSGDITGGTFPARIWTAYMKVALKGVDVVKFPEPANINKDAAPPPPSTTKPPATTATTSAPPTSEPPPASEPPPSEPPPSEPPPEPSPSDTTTQNTNQGRKPTIPVPLVPLPGG